MRVAIEIKATLEVRGVLKEALEHLKLEAKYSIPPSGVQQSFLLGHVCRCVLEFSNDWLKHYPTLPNVL